MKTYQRELWRGIFIYEIRIEDVELIALYDLRRWIIHVVVSLIVFVPFEAGVYPVKIRNIRLVVIKILKVNDVLRLLKID